jgi:hypothetical protein
MAKPLNVRSEMEKNGYSGDCSLADRMDRVYEKDIIIMLCE